MNPELHIAGIVVHVAAHALERIVTLVAAMPGAEVHAASRDGKLVVTMEAASARAITDAIEHIQSLDHVISAALVYQHNEALDAMMEEVTYEDHKA